MKIRAHHLLCLQGFRGLGYSPEFIKKMEEVKRKMERRRDDFLVEVVDECDDICEVCPYQLDGVCQKGKRSAKRTRVMDQTLLKILGLKKGRKISSQNLFSRIKEKLNFSLLIKVCGECGWREVCIYYLKLRNRWRKKVGLI